MPSLSAKKARTPSLAVDALPPCPRLLPALPSLWALRPFLPSRQPWQPGLQLLEGKLGLRHAQRIQTGLPSCVHGTGTVCMQQAVK